MEDFYTTSRSILLMLEAELPPADEKEGDPPEEGAELPEPQADAPAAPAAPMATPIEPASPRECLYTDNVLKALMFDYDEIPTKALVVFDMSNPEQILHFVQKITGDKTDISKYKVETEDGDQADSSAKPMLHRQKQILAQLMLKALRYDSKQLNVNSSLATDKVTPDTAKQIQKELSVLLAV